MENMNKIIWNGHDHRKELNFINKNSKYVMDDMPFNIYCSDDSCLDKEMRYEVDERYISFFPKNMEFDDTPINTIKKTSIIAENSKIHYKNIFGNGIHIEVEGSRTSFNKVIKIDSIKSLGKIPKDAKFLKINFYIETDSDFLDNAKELSFTNNIKFTENSTINAVKAWYTPNEVPSDTPEDIRAKQENSFVQCEGKFHKIGDKLVFTKYIPISFLLNAIFPIYTDIVITYGNVANCRTGQSAISVDALSSTSFVAAYITSAGDGICKIGTVSNSTISFGSEYSFTASGSVYLVKVISVSDTRFIILFRSASVTGSVLVGNVSGTTITYSPYFSFSAAAVYSAQAVKIDSTHAAVVFCDSNNRGVIRLLTIASNGVGVDSFDFFDTGSVSASEHSLGITLLSSTTLALFYMDGNYGSSIRVISFSTSLKTVTLGAIVTGPPVIYNDALAITTIDSSTFVITYNMASYTVSTIYTVSGTTATLSSSTNVASGRSFFVLSKYLNNNNIFLGTSTGSPYYGNSGISTLSGSSLSTTMGYYFYSSGLVNNNNFTSVAALSNNSFVIGVGGTDTFCVIGTIPVVGKKINSLTYVRWDSSALAKWNSQ